MWAEILFQIGRGRTIWAIVIFVHLLLLWLWRRERSIAWLSLLWLIVFSFGSAISFFTDGLVENAMNGTGYVHAHLYQGLWATDETALQGMLDRWQSVWLPLYAQWLGIWLAGLLLIYFLRLRRRKNKEMV